MRPLRSGWVAEWFKAPVLKTGVRETVPGVRIPPQPLYVLDSGHPALTRTEYLSRSCPKVPTNCAAPFGAAQLENTAEKLLSLSCE